MGKEGFVDQKEGLRRLNGFLNKGVDFSVLQPFTLDLSSSMGNKEYTHKFYVGARNHGDLNFIVTIPRIYQEKGIVALDVFPVDFKVRDTRYFWLDIPNQVVPLEFIDESEALYLTDDRGSQKANEYIAKLLGEN